MINRIFQAYLKLATGKNILFLFLVYILFVGLVMLGIDGRLKALSGGVGTVDLMTGYTPAKLYERMKLYGSQGREFYTLIELSVEIVFPVIYSIFLTSLIVYLCNKISLRYYLTKILLLFPISGMVADYIENICITVILVNYPYKLIWVAQVANIFTGLKWLFAFISSTIILISILLFLILFIKYKLTFKSISR